MFCILGASSPSRTSEVASSSPDPRVSSSSPSGTELILSPLLLPPTPWRSLGEWSPLRFHRTYAHRHSPFTRYNLSAGEEPRGYHPQKPISRHKTPLSFVPPENRRGTRGTRQPLVALRFVRETRSVPSSSRIAACIRQQQSRAPNHYR